MKRDMDLVRRILLSIERQAVAPGEAFHIGFEGISEETVSYHVLLMSDAGLLDAIDFSSADSFHVAPVRLRWEGHEFLDKIRSDTVWNKIKSVAMEKTGALSFQAISTLATTIVARALA